MERVSRYPGIAYFPLGTVRTGHSHFSWRGCFLLLSQVTYYHSGNIRNTNKNFPGSCTANTFTSTSINNTTNGLPPLQWRPSTATQWSIFFRIWFRHFWGSLSWAPTWLPPGYGLPWQFWVPWTLIPGIIYLFFPVLRRTISITWSKLCKTNVTWPNNAKRHDCTRLPVLTLFQIQQLFWGIGRVGPNSRYGRRFQTNSGLFKAHYDAEFHPT